MILLNVGDYIPSWITGTKYDSFYVISHATATGSKSSTMHYSHAHRWFVSIKIKFKKTRTQQN